MSCLLGLPNHTAVMLRPASEPQSHKSFNGQQPSLLSTLSLVIEVMSRISIPLRKQETISILTTADPCLPRL